MREALVLYCLAALVLSVSCRSDAPSSAPETKAAQDLEGGVRARLEALQAKTTLWVAIP